MPYYRITVKLKWKPKPVVGVRELKNPDVDFAWRHYLKKAETNFPGSIIEHFEVVMLSKLSTDVDRFLKRKRRPPAE